MRPNGAANLHRLCLAAEDTAQAELDAFASALKSYRFAQDIRNEGSSKLLDWLIGDSGTTSLNQPNKQRLKRGRAGVANTYFDA